MMLWLFTSWLVYIVHIALIVGVAGTFFSYFLYRIPFVWRYATLIKTIALPLLVVSIFFEGYFFAAKSWMEETKKFEEKVKVAEEQSKEVNVKLDTALKEKNQVVQKQKIVIQERIREVQVKVNAECKVSPEAIKILNDAASVK
jgi:high-affinity Fe2+/Pb2+ permease